MTEPENPVPAAAPRRSSFLRRFLLRHVPLGVAGIVVLVVLATVALYFVMSSARFENFVRERLIAEIEQSTGGRAEIASFHWHLLQLEAEAAGIVIHGREAATDAPYARIDRLRARLSILGLWSPSVRLRDLEIVHPALHLIVYPDGSTNQPQPRRAKSSQHPLDVLFDLRAGHIAVEQGIIDFDSRATSFDFEDRYAPLDFQASDLSVVLRYIGASPGRPEIYRIEAGATDLDLARKLPRSASPSALKSAARPVHGYFQATVDLARNAATLHSFRLTTRGPDRSSHTLEVSGTLDDFKHPRWQARVFGDVDLRLLDPVTGYPNVPEGIAHLDLAASGEGAQFRAHGPIHVENGSYVGTGVVATGVRLDAQLQADQDRLLIYSIFARLHQGGEIDGVVDLSPWLSAFPGSAEAHAGAAGNHRSAPVQPLNPGDIPMDGKVSAQFKNVALDTILDMVSAPPFQRLGIGTLVNGPATATWSNGDTATIAVSAKLGLNLLSHPLLGEVPGYGVVDATYTQSNGTVDLRKFELSLPASRIAAHGSLGAHPMTSASALVVDFHSGNLGEFDTVLRGLGFKHNGHAGAAALPVALSGQADFHGSWAGSLVNPRVAGNLSASQLAFEMPADVHGGQPRMVQFDSIEASGSYAAAHIAIDHAVLLRGQTRVAFGGSLSAPSGAPAAARSSGIPAFDRNSVLHTHLVATGVGVGDLQPFFVAPLPFTGSLDAQLRLDGPLHAPSGSGWVQLEQGSLYGEPVHRVRAQGKLANQVVTVASLTVVHPAGSVSGSGSYDFNAHRFQFEARGSAVDVSKVEWLRRHEFDARGKLAFDIRGSGTPGDPQFEGNATLAGLAVEDEPVGGLKLAAHTVNHALIYDVSTHLDNAQFTMHGQTMLKPDYVTQATLHFSDFNIDSLLKLAHVQAVNGQSSLAGEIAVQGPLAHPEQLRGEARIQQLEATVAGVHLKSEGQVHATLAGERIRLDPLHVTGEDTDLRAEGSLALSGSRQLDLATSGSVNLKLAETLDPDLSASGITTFQVEAHGPLKEPQLQGRIDFQNGALSLEGLPNGLSQLHGTLVFNQDRLEVKSLTAMSGGGPLSVGGYLSYQHGIYADLSVTGKGVRIRYPEGISSLADATLHLQGSQNNLLLSGDVLITRFTVSPEMDFAALAAQTGSKRSITPPNAPSNHIRLDVRIRSSPQLNFQNAFAKLAGDLDLRLRGTAAAPSLQGRVSITEGSAMIAGTRYDLQRGDIAFTNPVRIEPVIDLSATARVEDYDITLDLHGTPDKLAVNYRSDPPLPEADVVALLAMGRTGNQQRLYTQQQERALSNPTTDALLGGALNATVSSRVQKLFGAGSVKVDPNYLGPFGNSTSRIIVEEQLGRNVTLTYATDVNTTAQQLLQAEIAINHHVSLLVARDESGVFSMVVKATRRFR